MKSAQREGKHPIDQLEICIIWARFTLTSETKVYFKVDKAKIEPQLFRLSSHQVN